MVDRENPVPLSTWCGPLRCQRGRCLLDVGSLDVGTPHHRLYWRDAELVTLSLEADLHFRVNRGGAAIAQGRENANG